MTYNLIGFLIFAFVTCPSTGSTEPVPSNAEGLTAGKLGDLSMSPIKSM